MNLKTTKRKVTKVTYFKNTNDVTLLYEGWQEGGIVFHPVYVTKNYDFFKKLEGNREPSKQHINKMLDSISQLGVNRDVVVVDIEAENTIGVVDGQHELKALMKLGVSIVFKYIKVPTMKEAIQQIIKMNTTSKNWGVNQFMDLWLHFNPHYQRLQKYVTENEINIQLGAYILYGHSETEAKRALRSGEFSINLSLNRINHIFGSINRLYQKTGLVRGQYCTRGFYEFMKDKADYTKREEEFLNRVSQLAKKREMVREGKKGGFAFATRENAESFFNECWG
jgi:hypothetical protein